MAGKRKSNKPKQSSKPETASPFPEITDPKRRAFLAAYAETGCVTRAAKAANVAERSHRGWKTQDGPDGELYRTAFAEAHDIACDYLEAEARRRAVEGVRKLKFHKGDPIRDPETNQPYFEHEYSDTLLIFLMKGAMPEKYRERSEIRHQGADEIIKPLAEIVKECIEFLDAGPTTCPEPAEGANPESTNGDGHGNAGNGDLQ